MIPGMKTLRALLVFVVVLLALALGFIYSGLFDVAASSPDASAVRWVVHTVRERSVARRMKDVQVPPLTDPALIRSGFLRYQESCVTCHGAPGVEASEIGQGLSPYPPELATASQDANPRELFWIVKNGIKMTGMPAFGVTHTDPEIWATVAFLLKMPKMTPAEYQAMAEGAREEGHREMGHQEAGRP
jgi:mono/diheme cytochrome c family protein